MFDAIERALGLTTSFNPLTTAPGAMAKADNIVIRRENVIEDRRGYAVDATLANNVSQFIPYKSKVLANNGTLMSYGPSSYLNYAFDSSLAYSPISGLKMRFAEAASNLYVTTSAGIKIFTDVAGTAARAAGMPRMLDPAYALDSATSGFLANGYQCAYRCVIQRTDANSNTIIGYPSQRLWVTNPASTVPTTGNTTSGSASVTSIGSTSGLVVGMTVSGSGIPTGTTVSAIVGSTITLSQTATATATGVSLTFVGGNSKNIDLTIYLPAEAQANDVVKIYRTKQVSGTAADGAGDECFLCYRATITSTDVSAGFITSTPIVDVALDALLGESLYTNASQQGSFQANDRPPVAQDLALFKTFMFYANCSTKQRYTFTLLSASALGVGFKGDTTSGSPTISNITSTSGIAVGWKVSGSGIPAGATVASFTPTSVTLSTNATATASQVQIAVITTQSVTIAGTPYSFGPSEVMSGANPQVAVGTTGVVASDIDATARSLCRVINRCTANTSIYAYYMSGPSDLPGMMMLEERGIGAAAFSVQASDSATAAAFDPSMPVAPATSTRCFSANQTQPNAVYFSKDKEYEHVPTLNFLLVGAANKKILRIVPLRNSLIVIKEEGVYRITGDNANSFSATPLDLTVYCKARDSVAAMANNVYMLSNQGIVAISESGVQVISREIANLITPLFTNTNLANLTFGIGYESEGSYLLSTITSAADTVANQTLVYNIYTKTWVRWTFGFSTAMIETSTDKLYFATPSSAIVNAERKSFTDSDYADPEQAVTITAVGTNSVTITTTGSTPQVGWALSQGSTTIPIQSVLTGPSSFTLTLSTAPPPSWATGAATLYPSVGAAWEWLPWVGGNAGGLKQVRLAKILVDSIALNSTETSMVATFRSNFDDQESAVTLTQSGSGWGAAWGSMPWGGGGDSYGYPTYVPANKQYCARLMVGVRHVNAFEKISVVGVAFEFEQISGVIGR